MPQHGSLNEAWQSGTPGIAAFGFAVLLSLGLALGVPTTVAAQEPLSESPAPSANQPIADNSEAFNSAMSKGIAELSRGQLRAAREAFERAAKLRPEDPATREGLFQVQLASQRASLLSLKKQALLAEEREDWSKAATLYRTALEKNSTLIFARIGLQRSEERGALLGQLDQLLERPDRLESRAVLDQARALAERGETLAEKGTATAERAEALQRLVQEASTPIAVDFISDGQTQVLVYKVGNLGTFAQRQVALHPGSYTVVGSRDGYRDVRKTIRVESGKTPEPVRVICEEPFQ